MKRYMGLVWVLALLWAGAAWADSYSISNQAGTIIRLQSKAVRFSPDSDVANKFFELAPGGSRRVDFGDKFHLLMLHVYNKADMVQSYHYDVAPTPEDPLHNWLVTVKMGAKNLNVDMVEQ